MSERTCSVEGCERPAHARGWCPSHYARWRKYGDPATPLVRHPNIGTCAVGGCDEPSRKLGLCSSHYAQQYHSGQPPKPFGYKWAERGSCLVCGAPCEQRGLRQFCSGRCQMRESRSRREYADASRPTKPCALCGAEMDLLAPGVGKNGQPGSRKRRADSSLCADCRRQNGYRHHYSVQALAARDGMACAICGELVDMTFRVPDPLSPSVDHIVSRADGGSDDPSNLQLAHLTCNHRKSRRSGWTMT